MRRARFVAVARQEFLDEVAYYNEAQPGLGSRFTVAIEEATARAVAFPLAGSPSVSNTRRVFLKGFPFSLVYRPEDDGIVIFPFHTMRADLATGLAVYVAANFLSHLHLGLNLRNRQLVRKGRALFARHEYFVGGHHRAGALAV